MTEPADTDATHILAQDHRTAEELFAKFEGASGKSAKEKIAKQICDELKIHAQIEEEIFYPAVRKLMSDSEVMRNSIPEHDEMRRMIGELRQLEPGTYAYDDKVYELMREVLHHVADEETVLLPAAERSLAGQLDELGAEMTRRRLQLAGPQAGKIGLNMARAMPGLSVFMLGAVIGLGAWAARTPRHG